MHLETERRSNGPSRLPVDLLVELSHEGDEDVYEADAIDLGPGGIGLRASVLPEIGQRLRCRFELPGQYELCETRGEVVWAVDAGRLCGAFGVRFEDVDPHTARALAALPFDPAGTRTVKVHLDGVGSAIEGEIVSQGDTISVEQNMPFLQIGRSAELEQSGVKTRAVLERVRLRVEGGTPRLVLELAPFVSNEERDEVECVPTADATIQDEPLEALIAKSVTREETPQRKPEREAPRVVSRSEAMPTDESGAREELALKARLDALIAATKPQLAKALVATRALATLVMAKSGPWLVRVRDGVVALFRLLASSIAQRAPRLGAALGQAPRRRTALPPVATVAPPKRVRGAAPVVVPAPPVRLRTVLLLVLVIAAVGSAAYGLASGPEETAEIQIRPSSSAAAPAPMLAAPVTVPETIEPIVPPSPAAEAAPALPTAPPPGWDRAMPEPVTAAGPIPAPSYPSLQDRRTGSITSTSEEVIAPSEAPSEAHASMEFGAAEVERGRTTTLRMSAPVQGIEGQADEGGFTITIRGALSLDRAAPLAAASSSIERASIINRGDHAVLTIRFVTGRTPAYRVAAHGTSLDITIGR
jgi:hypothetical protein